MLVMPVSSSRLRKVTPSAVAGRCRWVTAPATTPLSEITDTIERFTPDGIQLASGRHLDADVVVTATGLNVQFLGNTELVVDGETVDPAQHVSYRGMMLDVSRHFMPLGDVKALIDELAALKFNTFHWHLTDDQGWRIEIKRYPKLTDVGAWRRRTLKGHASAEPAEYDDTPHGGFYTQDDVREVVAYAAARRAG